MEGIFDGAAIDTCWVCGLLAPSDECARCGGRMRYRPAAMMDAVALAAAVRARVDDHLRERSPATLEALAALLHRFAPASLDELARDGRLDLAALRADYRDLETTSL